MSQMCSKMVIFLFSAYFDGHFCYHSNNKSNYYQTLTLVIVLINKKEKNGYKQPFFFFFFVWGGGASWGGGRWEGWGGANSLFMHVALYNTAAFYLHYILSV